MPLLCLHVLQGWVRSSNTPVKPGKPATPPSATASLGGHPASSAAGGGQTAPGGAGGGAHALLEPHLNAVQMSESYFLNLDVYVIQMRELATRHGLRASMNRAFNPGRGATPTRLLPHVWVKVGGWGPGGGEVRGCVGRV